MFMKDDKKKSTTLIMSKLKGYDKLAPKPEQDGAEMADEDPKLVVVDEILSAMERKDKLALRDSLKSFIQMCSDEYSDEDSQS